MNLGRQIREIVLVQSKRANVGHIGSCLSVADILALIFSELLPNRTDEGNDRSRFVMSKGHAALALYAALHCTGRISTEVLNTFCTDGTLLGIHPEHQLPDVDFATGSLGIGLSFAAGAALAGRIRGSRRQVYALLSDAECDAGATWESAMFVGHHGLEQVTAFVDVNGQQALGYTRDVLRDPASAARWKAFGWDAIEVDGHDIEAMTLAVRQPRDGRPRALLCRTVAGSGVSFMEGEIAWHYLAMSDEQFDRAMREIRGEE